MFETQDFRGHLQIAFFNRILIVQLVSREAE